MNREIWFEKVLWSYMPCHWKGFALIATFALGTVGAIIFGQMILKSMGISDANEWPLLIMLPAIAWVLAIAKRHT
ncbi:hypothetical protein EUV02_09785 [Polymorphobacter arshaanensis]|uniref:Uncharacterized protein n=1 Tax=Glacieibacterium arshaanense TaxID=2511025 RepID=A0A4Y9ENV3_9SPHN|nr:hypothetical protein EUV02_09785 [Polymorphobacter arshaanensis]